MTAHREKRTEDDEMRWMIDSKRSTDVGYDKKCAMPQRSPRLSRIPMIGHIHSSKSMREEQVIYTKAKLYTKKMDAMSHVSKNGAKIYFRIP